MNVKTAVLTLATWGLAISAQATAAGHTNDFQQVQERSDTQLETFIGTVWRNDGKFVLRSHKIWYQLDDQQSAAKFEGKQVRVTGRLDGSSRSIHVQDIEEDPVQYK